MKNLYKGDTLEKAADRVGKLASTGSRWARRWNEGGLGLLTPNFGGGLSPKLDKEKQEELLELRSLRRRGIDGYRIAYGPGFNIFPVSIGMTSVPSSWTC